MSDQFVTNTLEIFDNQEMQGILAYCMLSAGVKEFVMTDVEAAYYDIEHVISKLKVTLNNETGAVTVKIHTDA